MQVYKYTVRVQRVNLFVGFVDNCLMVPVSKWHSDGSDPCTSSVAKAIANRPQSQPFVGLNVNQIKCSVSAHGLIMELMARFTAKEILDGVPLL